MLGAVAVVGGGGVAGATAISSTAPRTFSVTRLQALEISTVVGFVRAYNRADLKSALSYLWKGRSDTYSKTTATDCDYRRQTTKKTYVFRQGFIRWLRGRFRDHDRLTIGRIFDENPAQPVGVVGVEYSRRTSDTLRKLGYPNGIVPQASQKLPLHFQGGLAKFPFFGLASPSAPTPNPECKLVRAKRG
jgi:hypothetical protein